MTMQTRTAETAAEARARTLNQAIDSVLGARDRIDAAWEAYRQAVDAEITARQQFDVVRDIWQQAFDEAVYTAGFAFTVEGNKTWLEENGQRRSLTADEREAWCRRRAAADPDVAAEGAKTDQASRRADKAKADLAVATTGLSVAKHLLQARQSVLDALSAAIPDERF